MVLLWDESRKCLRNHLVDRGVNGDLCGGRDSPFDERSRTDADETAPLLAKKLECGLCTENRTPQIDEHDDPLRRVHRFDGVHDFDSISSERFMPFPCSAGGCNGYRRYGRGSNKLTNGVREFPAMRDDHKTNHYIPSPRLSDGREASLTSHHVSAAA